METRIKRHIAMLAAVVAMSALSACGSAGSPADDATADSGQVQPRVDSSWNLRSAEDSAIWPQSECGYAAGIFGPMIDGITQRFSQAAVSARSAGLYLDYAGHPDAPGGVSVMACPDGKIAASASNSRIYISDGLLWLLAGAAEAKISSGGSIDDYNARLDSLIAGIVSGEPDANRGDLSADALGLASSAVAFVVYHEIAHTQMDKLTANSDLGDQSSAEMKADIFAARAIAETGYDINGVDIVFEALQRAVPFGSMDHPAASERAKIAIRAGKGESLDGFME